MLIDALVFSQIGLGPAVLLFLLEVVFLIGLAVHLGVDYVTILLMRLFEGFRPGRGKD